MPLRRGLLLALLCVLAFVGRDARAQIEADKSRALLRQDPETTVYYVEVQLDAAVPSLDPSAPADRRPAPLSDLNTFLRHKKLTVQRASDVMLCAPGGTAYKNYLALRGVPGRALTPEEKRRVCEGSEVMPWRYYFWLPGRPLSHDGYAVSYDFNDASNVSRADNLPAQTDFVAEVRDDRNGCVVPDKRVPYYPEKRTVPLLVRWRYESGYSDTDAPNNLPASDEEYRRERLAMIFNQLKVSNSVTMRLEPREDGVEKDPVPAKIIWLDYRPFRVVKDAKEEKHLPPRVEDVLMQGALVVCVEPERPLPAGEVHVELKFDNNPPVELAGPLRQTMKAFVPVVTKKLDPDQVKKVLEDNKLGYRTLNNKLDAAIAFTSAVKDVEKEIEGKKTKVRERDNDWVLDLLLAPVIKERGSKPQQKKVQKFVTPFFLDAKLSTGKVDKDSLSVNRFIIGYEREYRYYTSTKINERNIYRVFGRLLHTSDRDLKRPEVKAQIEFRPTFDALNNPLEYEYFATVLDPKREDKKRLKRHFGYLIQPFVGGEAGRTYREGRTPLAVEEASRNVRRLFFGMDISLFVTEKMTFTINDTFYVRGETPSDRGRNYFKSEANFFFNDSQTTPLQGFFLSFESGDQPPFVSKAANVFKGGYRIRSNLLGLLGP